MNKRFQDLISALLIILGLVVLVLYFNLTGNVISSEIVNKSVNSIIGLVLVIVGLVMFMARKDSSKLEVAVFKSEQGKKGMQTYITDPENYFATQQGYLSLGQFRKEISDIRNDEELMEVVSEAYVPKLTEIYEAGGEKAELARQFLEELGVAHERGEESEEETGFTNEERSEVKRVFMNFNPKALTKAQRAMLKQYDVRYQFKGTTHPKFVPIRGGTSVTTSLSPSDQRARKEVIKDLRKLFADQKERMAQPDYRT